MLAAQRQKLIADEIRREGQCASVSSPSLLDVSEMTIRRDLDVLESAGLIEKVHGGATARGGAERGGAGLRGEVTPAAEGEGRDRPRREPARASPASRSASRAGTTTWRLAQHLAQIPDLTVVTNSIQVANVLHRVARPDLTVVLTGGVRTPSDALVGTDRADGDPLAPSRRPLHGRPRRDGRRRPDDAQPARGRDRPRARRGLGASSSWSPTTRNGASAASAGSRGLEDVDVLRLRLRPRPGCPHRDRRACREARDRARSRRRAQAIRRRTDGVSSTSRPKVEAAATETGDLRTDALSGASTFVVDSRQDRPNLPEAGCPFCPGGLEAPEPYDVRWFTNRWPAMPGRPLRGRALHAEARRDVLVARRRGRAQA